MEIIVKDFMYEGKKVDSIGIKMAVATIDSIHWDKFSEAVKACCEDKFAG